MTKTMNMTESDDFVTIVGDVPDTLPIHDFTKAVGLQEIAKTSYEIAGKSGWHEKPITLDEACSLVISEASEALEDWRKGTTVFLNTPEYDLKRYLTHARTPHKKLYKPTGIASELADIVIRCAHYLIYFKANSAISDSHYMLCDDTFSAIHMNLVADVAYTYMENCPSNFMAVIEWVPRLGHSAGVDVNRINHLIAAKSFFNRHRPYRHGNKQC